MYISEKKEMENGLLASTKTHYGGKALHRRWVDYGYIKMGKEWEIKTDETYQDRYSACELSRC